ncbi:hypothetical protein [Caulobacter sp. DWR1-3-2b1]|uniref:hypothetical protein n=1 Tax=Caulobacter sp. DWR1-3-2b1 TaxID=2804670 RepID=UPI003CE73F93
MQVSGVPPIRATKVRYYMDRELAGRVADPQSKLPPLSPDTPSEWSSVIGAGTAPQGRPGELADEGGHRIEPEFEAPVGTPPPPPIAPEAWLELEVDADESLQAEQARRFRAAARVAALDPDDGIPL